MRGLPGGHSDQRRKLRQRDDDGGGVDEAHQHRLRQQIDRHAHAQQAEAELEQTRQQRQQHRVGDERVAAQGRERCDAGRGEQRGHRHRARGQLRRRAEQNTDNRGQQRGVQSVISREPGELRIGERLGDDDQRHGDSREHVVIQSPFARTGPAEKRKNVRKDGLAGGGH